MCSATAHPPTPYGSPPGDRSLMISRLLHFATHARPGALVRAARRRARLLERMRAREGVDLEAFLDDPRHGRIGLEIDLEQFRADRVGDEADVGQRDLVAVAVAAGLLVAAEMGLERGERLVAPVADPFQPRRLVELELMFEIIAHPRH